MGDKDAQINGIIEAANRHPNSKLSQLIYEFQNTQSRATLVLLLEELATSKEAGDFSISLQYYMDCFLNIIRKNSDPGFNESGRILESIARIWGRRVEDLHAMVTSSKMELTNTCQDAEEAAKKRERETNTAAERSNAPKPKRRKKVFEIDPYSITTDIKKFKTLQDKLYAMSTQLVNQIKTPAYFAEVHINPTLFRNSFINDPDNPETIDSKRNYQVIAYHIEHRYNTPVPDINFRWHFTIKDFMAAEEMDEAEEFPLNVSEDQQWMPLTYLNNSIRLENKAFERKLDPDAQKKREAGTTVNDEANILNKLPRISIETLPKHPNGLQTLVSQESGFGDMTPMDSMLTETFESNLKAATSDKLNANTTQNEDFGTSNVQIANSTMLDTGIGSMQQSSVENMEEGDTDTAKIADSNIDVNCSSLMPENVAITLPDIPIDSDLQFNQSSILESTKLGEQDVVGNLDLGYDDAKSPVQVLPDVLSPKDKLTSSDDEGISLSDHEESYTISQDQENLSLNVVVNSINRQNLNQELTTTTDNINENSKQETNTEQIKDASSNEKGIHLIEEIYDAKYPLVKNIMKVPEKYLRRTILFKISEEINLIIQQKRQNPKINVSKKDESKKDKTTTKDAASAAAARYNAMGIPTIFFTQTSKTPIKQDAFQYESDDNNDCPYYDYRGCRQEGDDEELPQWPRSEAWTSTNDGPFLASSDENFANDAVNSTEINVNEEATANIATEVAANSTEISANMAVEKEVTESMDISAIQSSMEGVELTEDLVDATQTEITATLESSKETENKHNNTTIEASETTAVSASEPMDVDDDNNDNFSEADEFYETFEDLNINDEQHAINKKAADWHKSIEASLKEVHKRQHFSIYDIGTKTIDKLTDGGETFADVMESEDPSDASKIFLSLLMLTNQGNVELDRGNSTADAPTDYKDLKIKLISKERHKVSFEDDIGAPEKQTKTSATTSKAKAPATTTITTGKRMQDKPQEIEEPIINMVRIIEPISKARPTMTVDSGLGESIATSSSFNSSKSS